MPELPENPDELLEQGWEEITHPGAEAHGHREFRNRETGLRVRYDKPKPTEGGFKEEGHYHVYNPNKTGNRDLYLDRNGLPTHRGSDASHIFPKAKTT